MISMMIIKRVGRENIEEMIIMKKKINTQKAAAPMDMNNTDSTILALKTTKEAKPPKPSPQNLKF